MSHCIDQTSYGTPTGISYFYGAGWQEDSGRRPGTRWLTERPAALTISTEINLNGNQKKVQSPREENVFVSSDF